MALFQSYSGGPHGASPIVLPEKKSPLGEIGDALGALGKIPEQMQQAQYKKMLTDLLIKAISTDPTITQNIPESTTMREDTTFSTENVPAYATDHQEQIGDFLTKTPASISRSMNPEYLDIMRKLEVSGVYKPTASSRRSQDRETPEAEALRAGMKETAIQKAKEPERDEARAARKAQTDLDREVKISNAGDVRRAGMERRDETERRNLATEAETQRYHTDSIRIRELGEETRALRLKMDTDKAIATGNQQKANTIYKLNEQLTRINNAIKSPPPEASGQTREWDMNDTNDVSVIRGYLQQENEIMDQLEALGTTFPYRRQLQEVEKNWLASIVNNLTGGSTTTHRIGTTTRSPTRTAPAQTPSRGTGNPLNTNETAEQRRNRLLGR